MYLYIEKETQKEIRKKMSWGKTTKTKQHIESMTRAVSD